ncbi:fumarylacetoacetate hydrolase family protein [Halorubrum lacusprofundi]|jgi:2-keto-4-pentenoate hydratase/2-oxohepta-3-ene-1,7-dioic acid hydratase in catechol pathway|uniref:fumarylacetoacetate hydrolase family protein n=1 Tax=Halorubrum lacusprofundi TaxID=2247 RepID=UPI000B5A7597|nr:fumarylacetoacetate hydrolase family protein [Halorubrum lacusprofundi]MCG1007558.1 fumarylacetoacetate hydrolase family protein [Halorubrum lacusprofundi]
MQFVRYTTGSSPAWGIRRDEEIVPLAGLREEITYQQLTDAGFLRVVEDAVDAMSTQAIPLSEANLLAPVPRPGKIICVGLNYHDHAEEQGEDVPDRPLLFGKSGTAVTNPGDPIVHPAELDEVDFEVELGVVIGRTAKDISTADVRDYVAGYTAINDVSGRDAQFSDGQFFRGKSYDTFAPMGPTLVPDEQLEPDSLDVACRVNGETMQSSNTEEFIFGVEEVVSYISGITTLRPGDVISTGTPGGVGIFRDPPELLEPGDSVDVEIEGIGTLTNPVVAEQN